MGVGIADLVLSLRPLRTKEKESLRELSEYLPYKDIKLLKKQLKRIRIGVTHGKLNVSSNLMKDDSHLEIFLTREDKELEKKVKELNKTIIENVKKRAFRELAPNAKILKEFIAPNIIGLDAEKEAVTLQLFATDRIHVLLLGDPGTGKTDILRSANQMHPHSVFGLGSGTSGVGLGAMVKGKERIPGLLPMADNGLCCIDELNLMKNVDRAAMYNAMEKGFVSYDKGDSHFTLKARTRVLASANPTGDKFAGKFIDTLKKQLPFDPALLSRFHLVFLIRKPDMRGFVEITKKIIRDDNRQLRKEDADFLKGYIEFAENIDVSFPKKYEDELVDFVKEIKADEKKFLIEVSPRLVIGFIRMAKASARMHLRKEVEKQDIAHVKELVKNSLIVR